MTQEINGMDDARKIEIAEIAVIMSTKGGRKFINRVLDQCGVFTDTFTVILMNMLKMQVDAR
jgi:hypothetical protein